MRFARSIDYPDTVALNCRAAEVEKKWARRAMALPRPALFWAEIIRNICRTLSMENAAEVVVFFKVRWCKGTVL